MSKKFSTKKFRLRSRAEKRRFSLKVAPKTFGLKKTQQDKNRDVLLKLESKVKEIQAKQEA